MLKKKITKIEQEAVKSIIDSLSKIYGNKSSDEYKSHGDIRKVSCYKNIEKMLADLSMIKKFDEKEARELKMLFATLHRPVFETLVTEYLDRPNERNIIYACLYTAGYRALIGELSRIYTSTEATDDGLLYHPDKISKKNGIGEFIRAFNEDLDKRLDEYIRDINKHVGYLPIQEGAVADLFDKTTDLVIKVLGVLPKVFRAAKELNPVSFINACLMRSYDKKIEKFEEVSKMYEATKQAYDEYLQIPRSDRKRKIESKYKKNMKKYNIRMENLRAEIEHYDQRAIEEAKDSTHGIKPSSPITKPEEEKTTSSNETSFDDFDF